MTWIYNIFVPFLRRDLEPPPIGLSAFLFCFVSPPRCIVFNKIMRSEPTSSVAQLRDGLNDAELKLADTVTFTNEMGFTYTDGRVVAINPTPCDGYPHGRVRVKYEHWPDDG